MSSSKSSWETVKLSKVCDVRDGTHDSPKYVEKGYPLITSKNIKDGKLDFENVNLISENDYVSINKRSKVNRGDIIMPMIGTIGNPIIIEEEPNFAIKNVCLIKHGDGILSNYLIYVLKSDVFERVVNGNSRGGTQKFLSLGDLRNIQIPLPPLPTQKRISEILDKADALRKKDKQLLQYYDDLAQSLFIDMFGDPVGNEKGLPLSDLVNVNPTKSEAKLQDSDLVTFVSMSAVGETGEFDQSCIKKYQDVKSGFTYFRENDVLFAKITPCMENGKGAIARNLTSGVGFGSTEFHVFRPNDTILPEFLYHLFALPTFRKYAEINMSGSAGQKRVGLGFFKKVKINPPSIVQQNHFATQIQNIEQQKEKLKAQIQESENLFQALLQKAFNGGLN